MVNMRSFGYCIPAVILLLCSTTERCGGSATTVHSDVEAKTLANAARSNVIARASALDGGVRALQQHSGDPAGSMGQQPTWACPSGSFITEYVRNTILHGCGNIPDSAGMLRCGEVLASPQLVLEVTFSQCSRIQVRFLPSIIH